MTANPAQATSHEQRPIVEVEAVSKIYPGGTEALNHVTLDFPEGQLTNLLGPSGIGTTTQLKIIHGLIPANTHERGVGGGAVPGARRSDGGGEGEQEEVE